MSFAVGDNLVADWTPSHENEPRHLLVEVLEVLPLVQGETPLYRVQTNMGITMILPETDLARPN